MDDNDDESLQEEEVIVWSHKEKVDLGRLLMLVPTVACLLNDHIVGDALENEQPSTSAQELENATMTSAIHMFLGEFYSILNVPFVPRDLRNMIVSYAMTPSAASKSYYISETVSSAHWYRRLSNNGCYTGFVLDENEARAWCIEKLADSTGIFAKDETFEGDAWCVLYRTALEHRYEALTTEQIVSGLLDWINTRPSTEHHKYRVLAACVSNEVIRELVVPLSN
jgi:hypothetical protein